MNAPASSPTRTAVGDYDPEYIVRLIGQVIRVCVETVQIVAGLPEMFAD